MEATGRRSEGSVSNEAKSGKALSSSGGVGGPYVEIVPASLGVLSSSRSELATLSRMEDTADQLLRLSRSRCGVWWLLLLCCGDIHLMASSVMRTISSSGLTMKGWRGRGLAGKRVSYVLYQRSFADIPRWYLSSQPAGHSGFFLKEEEEESQSRSRVFSSMPQSGHRRWYRRMCWRTKLGDVSWLR